MVSLQAEYGVQRSVEKPTLMGVQLDYYDYVDSHPSPKEAKKGLETFSRKTTDVLINELESYATKTSAGTTEYQQHLAHAEFNAKLAGVAELDYPTSVIESINNSLIEYALSPRGDITPQARSAAAKIVSTIGHTADVDVASVERIIVEHKKILKTAKRNDSDVIQSRNDTAIEMLLDLGVKLYSDETPPIIETISKHVNEVLSKAVVIGKEHTTTVKAAGTAALVAGSIFAPVAANASTPSSLNATTVSVVSTTGNNIDTTPSVPSSSEATLTTTPVSSETSESITLGGSASTIAEPVPTLSTPETTVKTPVAKTPVEQQPAPTLTLNAAPPAEVTTLPSPVESTSPTPTTPEITAIPAVVAAAPETITAPSTPNQAPVTTDQMNAQIVTNKLNSNGDIEYAVSFINSSFGQAVEVSASTDATEQTPAAVIPNTAFLTNLQNLQSSYTDVLYAGGHTDVNSIHTTQMTIAVLEAAANDPSILQSKDVQGLVTSAVRPTDAYQARLFDQYLATAKTTLNSTMLAGISDPATQARVQEMYAYVLMADTSDTVQATNIQAMKDADAKAAEQAAEAAAAKKAAEEKAAADKAAAEKTAAEAAARKAAASRSAASNAPGGSSETALIQKTIANHTNARHRYVGPHSPTAAFGNCTDGVNELEALIGNILPGSLGDGKDYNTSLQNDGYANDPTPHVGDVANTATFTSPGNTHGHVGVVESVNSDGSFVLAEMNHTYFNGFDTRTISADVAKNQFHFTVPHK